MEKEKCKKYESCSAPFCPLDEEDLKNGMWFPDEEVCPLKDKATIPWIHKQKKIVKAEGDVNFYWDIEMLKSSRNIHKFCKGKDPDKESL